MRLKEEFITHNADGQQILIDTAGNFSGLVRSNQTAAFIVDCLKEDTTKEKIVAAMCEKYDAPAEVIEKDVSMVINKLRTIDALEE